MVDLKKVTIFFVAFVLLFILTSCEEPGIKETPNDEQPIDVGYNYDYSSLGILSYMSTSLLDEKIEREPEVSMGLTNLSVNHSIRQIDTETQTSIESRLDEITIYIDKLKSNR